MTDIDALAEWTAEAASHLAGPEADAWFARIEERYAVILLALERCSRGGPTAQAGVRIAVHLELFWIRSHRRADLGRAFLRKLLENSSTTAALYAEAILCLHRLDDVADQRVIPPDGLTGSSVKSVGGKKPMSHLEDLAAWTAEAGSQLAGPDQTIWLARIEARYNEIVRAVALTLGCDRGVDASLRIITNLEPFWTQSGREVTGWGWVRRLLPSSSGGTSVRADALLYQGRLFLRDRQLLEARLAALEAGQIYRVLGDARGVFGAFDLFGAAEKRMNPHDAHAFGRMPPMLDVVDLAGWTADAASHLSGPDQAEWLTRIDERLPEIVFAIHPGPLRSNDHPDARLRIAINLGRYWWMRGHAAWARDFLNDLLITSGHLTSLFTDGLLALAGLDYADARYAVVKQSCQQAAAIYRTLANDAGVAATLNQLGMAERESGDLGDARAHHEEALALYLALGDERGAVACRSNLGVVALFEGDLDVAETLHEAALAERQHRGDVRGIASSLGSLATIARLRGDAERAGEMHEEALAMRRELGDPWGVAGSLLNLGLVAIQGGDLAKASDLLGEATAGFTKVGDRLGVCETLDARALLTFAEDLPAEAVRLFAVAHRARETLWAPLPPVYRKEADRVLEQCKARIGGKAFDAAWKAGLSPQYSPFFLNPSEVP